RVGQRPQLPLARLDPREQLLEGGQVGRSGLLQQAPDPVADTAHRRLIRGHAAGSAGRTTLLVGCTCGQRPAPASLFRVTLCTLAKPAAYLEEFSSCEVFLRLSS